MNVINTLTLFQRVGKFRPCSYYIPGLQMIVIQWKDESTYTTELVRGEYHYRNLLLGSHRKRFIGVQVHVRLQFGRHNALDHIQGHSRKAFPKNIVNFICDQFTKNPEGLWFTV